MLVVYLSGVFFGAVGSLLLNPTQSIVGSSGAVYSLLFSHISQCILVRPTSFECSMELMPPYVNSELTWLIL